MLAAACIAAWHARRGTPPPVTPVISLSPNEEDGTGTGIDRVLDVVRPVLVLVCEPSNLAVVRGHKGKYALRVSFTGTAAHSSVPHIGRNAIYAAVPLIRRVEALARGARGRAPAGPVCSVTRIESRANSLNSIPYGSTVTVDYRSVPGETVRAIAARLFAGLPRRRMHAVELHRFFPAWELPAAHPLVTALTGSCRDVLGRTPPVVLWPFCTNGSASMGERGIPTAGFGPGDPALAHVDNESVPVAQVVRAAACCAVLPYRLSPTEASR